MDRASASRKRISPTARPFVPGRPIVPGRPAVPPPSPPTSTSTAGTGSPPSRRVNLPANQVPCRYFAAGYCQRGEECYFKHDLATVKIPGLQAAGTTEAEDKHGMIGLPSFLRTCDRAAVNGWNDAW